MTIGIQGEVGSYHELVANNLYGDEIELEYTESFGEVFDDLISSKTGRAIVAIANNRYGFIPETYSEIIDHHSEIVITGESYLYVRHQLLGLKGSDLNRIEEVYSHPAAIGQCHKYLESILPNATIIEHPDTAGSARYISEQLDPSKAAIAGAHVAGLYDLDILAPNIQDDKDNITRFLVIEKRVNQPHDNEANKTTALLRTGQEVGSLVDALNLFKEAGINLLNLHSSFLPNTEFEMQFFLEFDGGGDAHQMKGLIEHLRTQDTELSLIGSYRSADINSGKTK